MNIQKCCLILDLDSPATFAKNEKRELKLMVDKNRPINILNKNAIDMITSCKAVLKRLDYELGHKDANAGKTTIARANAISRIQSLASFAAAA